MKSKKILAGLLTAVLTLSSMTALASSSDITDTAYYDVKFGPETFSDKTSEVTTAFPNVVEGSQNANLYYLQETNGNIYRSMNRYGTGSSWTALYYGISLGEMTEVGEYVYQNKLKFSDDWTGTAHIAWRMNTNAFYFQITSVNPTDLNAESIQFKVGNTVKQTSTFAFQTDTWYTIRQIFNLNKKTAVFQIYNASGAKLHSMEVDVTECGVTNYNSLIFAHLRMDMDANVKGLGIDDFTVSKATQKPVTVTVGEHGKVQYNNTDVVSGAETPVTYNADATFTIVPDKNYEVDTITVNDNPVAVKDNSVTLANVMDAQKMSVTFKESEASAPSVGSIGTSYVFTTDYKDGQGSQVAYFTINPGSGYTFTKGIAKLTTTSGETLTLESGDMLTYANAEGWDGRYGVRIYGDGLQSGV